ncbi:MAG TPA: NRDE family protein [Gemmatimonadales bacterium]|nr:NRDE family protein [Gemmatimonadales bacterium]
MCLLLLALDSHPHYQLIVAANRDEFYDRPTASAHFWSDAPAVLGGLDLQAGGTWLGVDRRGRFAAVTNYRQGERETPAPRSRGLLVSEYLKGNSGTRQFMESVERDAGLYNGFNLIAGDAGGLFYYSNREGRIRRLQPGVYGLSNHLLDTPWPKVSATKSAFGALLRERGAELTTELFALLADRQRAPDGQLPATGISQEWEQLLSSAFIASDRYGTRSSTVVLFGRNGSIRFIERNFGPGGVPGADAPFQIGA